MWLGRRKWTVEKIVLRSLSMKTCPKVGLLGTVAWALTPSSCECWRELIMSSAQAKTLLRLCLKEQAILN
jgi:hypothetical protein